MIQFTQEKFCGKLTNCKIKARPFVELTSNIEEKIEDDVYIFKSKGIRNLYKNRLNEWVSETEEVKKQHFNQSLINHFEEYDAQQQSNGKQKLLVFRRVDFSHYEFQ